MSSKKIKSMKGFTIVELAIVMAFASLVFYYALLGFRLYKTYRTASLTQERMTDLTTTIEKVFAKLRRYPCPARMDLVYSDPAAGEEECLAIPAINTCNNGLCYATGSRDANGDGDLTNDNVLIGAFPYKAYIQAVGEGELITDMRIQENTGIDDVSDGWYNRLTYAVTESMTDTATFDQAFGAVNVETELGVSVTDPAGGAHFVIVSHGKNKMGAFTMEGVLASDCVAGTVDFENCDGDADFINGVMSLGDNAGYYDDYILFRIWQSTDLWEQGPGDSLYNTNPQNVGINTDTPTEKLHIDGEFQSTAVHSNLICDEGGANCFDPEQLGGSGMLCPSGQLMTGIANNDVRCSAVTYSGSLLSSSCPPGEFIRGVTNLGRVICGAP